MKSKPINRREFVKGTAITARAVILAACAPDSSNPAVSDSQNQASFQGAPKQTNGEGKTMKALIIYDTLYGNTEEIAAAIKETLGRKHDVKLAKAAEAQAGDLAGIDLLLVGSPTHGGQYTEAIKVFFNKIPANGLKDKHAAAFDTSTTKENESGFVKAVIAFFGYASKRIAKTLTEKGANMIGAETFLVIGKEGPLVEGEIERSKVWVEGISLKGLTITLSDS